VLEDPRPLLDEVNGRIRHWVPEDCTGEPLTADTLRQAMDSLGGRIQGPSPLLSPHLAAHEEAITRLRAVTGFTTEEAETLYQRGITWEDVAEDTHRARMSILQIQMERHTGNLGAARESVLRAAMCIRSPENAAPTDPRARALAARQQRGTPEQFRNQPQNRRRE
jgi:hypothetical protein